MEIIKNAIHSLLIHVHNLKNDDWAQETFFICLGDDMELEFSLLQSPVFYVHTKETGKK